MHYKSSKSTNLIFSNKDGRNHQGDVIFKLSKHIDYLGHSVSTNGEIFISQHKLEKLKVEIRRKINYAFLAQRRILGSAPAQVKALINTVNLTFEEELAHPALLLMLATTTDQSQIKHFDRWVAKQILGTVFGTKHDRVFRYLSYRQLRIWGLKSLVQERNRRWQRTGNIPIAESKRISPDYELLDP